MVKIKVKSRSQRKLKNVIENGMFALRLFKIILKRIILMNFLCLSLREKSTSLIIISIKWTRCTFII